MKTAMGFALGQFGDILIQEPLIRTFLREHPDYNLVLCAYEKYAEVLNFYRGYSERIIGFYKFDTYEQIRKKDRAREFMREKGIDMMFNPMPKHKNWDWPLYRHQTVEAGDMFDILVEDPQIRLPRPPQVVERKNCIALCLFPNDAVGPKAVSPAKAQEIVAYCRSKGYEVLQINGPKEPILEGAEQTNAGFYNAGVAMLGCQMVITGDTAMSWLASGLEMPAVGLYALDYYTFAKTSKNWNPINKNAIYLEAAKVDDIPNADIFAAIDRTLN